MTRATSFLAIQAAIEAGERLTLAQGRSLLSYAKMQAEQAEKFAQSLDKSRQAEHDLALDLLVSQERLARLIDEYNEICGMLDSLFGLKVYCNELDGKEPIWTVEYQGKVSRGHKSVAEAYKAALSDLMKKGQSS